MLVTPLGMIVVVQPAINLFDALSMIALQLSRESYFVFPCATVMEVRPEQTLNAPSPMLVTLLGMVMEVRPLPWNADCPMLVTLLGMVMEVRPLPWNADCPMLVTLLGMVMEVRPEQPKNALIPMLVTLLGMVMEVRPEQPANAKPPMLVTLLGTTVFLQPAINLFDALSMIALQLSLESYFVFPCATVMEVRPEQTLNAHPPMLVTLLGIVTEVRPEQP